MGLEYYIFAFFIAALVCIVAIIFKVLFANVKRQNKMLDERETEILQTYNAVETIMEEFQDQAKATIDELKLREQEYRAALHNISAFNLPPELERQGQVVDRAMRSQSPDANRMRAAGKVIERAERFVTRDTAQTTSSVQTRVSAPPIISAPSIPVKPVAPVIPAAPSIPHAVRAAYTAQSPAPAPAPVVEAVPEVQAASPEKGVAKAAVFQSFFDDAAEMPPPTPYAPSAVNGGSRRDSILALAEEGKTDVEIASQLGITRNEVQMVIGLTK